jgi:hypothetical protein
MCRFFMMSLSSAVHLARLYILKQPKSCHQVGSVDALIAGKA